MEAGITYIVAYRLRALEAQGSKCEELTVSRFDSFRCVGFNSGSSTFLG